jgi:peroxiredoxin Q/BCP
MSRRTEGDDAPEFALETDTGTTLTSGDLRGERIVLYFYPKADTSGCTTQACDFTAARDDFDAAGLKIVGVSPDPVAKLARFRDKHDLGITLLSDPDHTLCEAYGVWVEKKMYGNTYMGVERSTFVISPEGAIELAMYKVRPKGHAAAVLEAASS